jgi:nicotinamidase-related amidase
MFETIDKDSALIIVDVQKDFCIGGALAVPHGDDVVAILNEYIKGFEKVGALIYATRDWHPLNHISFKSQGGPWPEHCIQNTEGSEFHKDLKLSETTVIVSKGTNPSRESYSGFDGTDLGDELKSKGVRKVFVGGLATDYCVKETVLDAIKLGFTTVLAVDAIRGVNVKPGDSDRAIKEMVKRGVKKVTLDDVVIENFLDEKREDIFRQVEEKKKARLRTRGPYRKAWRSI